MTDRHRAAEDALFDALKVSSPKRISPALHILGAPRTGSTLVYQILAHHYPFAYLSNFTNTNFFDCPALGVAIERGANVSAPISYRSAYGKTEGLWSPSEGSFVFRHWYGGDQPSQIKSKAIIPENSLRMDCAIDAIYELTSRPLLTKNAWNCFRIEDLATRYQNALFIWIRRDVVSSACSDLEARYHRGSATVWNSATTANVAEIQQLPYWAQVVEQQYEYSLAIQEGLQIFAPDRYLVLWYEDIVARPYEVLAKIDEFFGRFSLSRRMNPIALEEISPSQLKLSGQDQHRISDYAAQHASRLRCFRYEKRGTR